MKTLTESPIKLSPPGVKPEQRWLFAILSDVVKMSRAQNGVAVDEMRKRIRLLDILDHGCEPGESVDVEDADYDLLVELVDAMRWGWTDRAFVEVADLVKNAPTKK